MRTQLAQRKNQRIRITTEIIKITPIKKAKNTIYKLALRNITSTEFTGKVNHLYVSISAASLPKEDLLILETFAKKEKHPKNEKLSFVGTVYEYKYGTGHNLKLDKNNNVIKFNYSLNQIKKLKLVSA